MTKKTNKNTTYLALKIAPAPNGEHQDGDAQKGCAQRFAQLAQMVGIRRVHGLQAFSLGDGGVEAEELRDGDADGGEREGGAEPGEEGAFCSGTKKKKFSPKFQFRKIIMGEKESARKVEKTVVAKI